MLVMLSMSNKILKLVFSIKSNYILWSAFINCYKNNLSTVLVQNSIILYFLDISIITSAIQERLVEYQICVPLQKKRLGKGCMLLTLFKSEINANN